MGAVSSFKSNWIASALASLSIMGASGPVRADLPPITLEAFATANPWLIPTAEFEANRTLPVSRVQASGIPVYASPDNHWFDTDFAALRKKFNASDDLDLKEKWFDTFAFDEGTSSYIFPHPTLSYWDILPHPPVMKLSADLASHSIRYGTPHRPNTALTSRNYQSHLDEVTSAELSVGNQLSLRTDAAVFTELLAQIDLSKKSILASGMFVACDATVEPMFDALTAKIAAGVRVDFILEHAFALKFGKCFKRLKKIGAHVHYSNEMIRLENRTAYHAKFWVFDDESAMVFGLNPLDAEVEANGFNHLYHDSGVLIHGPMVRDLTIGFGNTLAAIHPRQVREIEPLLDEAQVKIHEERAAHLRGVQALPSDASAPAPQGLCRAVFQGPQNDLHRITTLYSDLIDHANESVFISMIRLPGEWDGEGALVEGVLKQLVAKTHDHPEFTSDILTNNYIGSTDVQSIDYSRKDFLTKVYRMFVGNEDNRKLVGETRAMLRPAITPNFKVWDYFQFTHQKTMMVDRTLSLIGTYNLDKLSAEESFEVMVMCYDDSFTSEIEKSSILDLMNSIPALRGK